MKKRHKIAIIFLILFYASLIIGSVYYAKTAKGGSSVVLRVFNANNELTYEATTEEFNLSKTRIFESGRIVQEIIVDGKPRIQHYYIKNGQIIKTGLGVGGEVKDGTKAGYIISVEVESQDGQPFYQVYGYE